METIGLPEAFTGRMKEMLGTEYEAFMESYFEERSYGLRMNPLKSGKAEFERKMPFSLSRIPWAAEGYFCPREERPGKHVYHEAGAYYIQEPSAMAVAELMEVKPSGRYLDLCAAPGGKSTQLAGKLGENGLLVSNEIVPGRARILSQNIERFGIRNCVVLNEDTDRLAEYFPLFFDGILVDAPCSGEGMFRKDEAAREQWSPEQAAVCSERQLHILENAHRMLLPGGRLVYSTCTFAPEENEGVLVRFIRKHPEYKLIEPVFHEGMDHGRPQWAASFGGVADFTAEENEAIRLEHSLRLWPHRLSGEGHFAACLVKTGGNEENRRNADGRPGFYPQAEPCKSREALKLWEAFSKEILKEELSGIPVRFGEHLYLVPEQMRALKGLKVERAGLALGELKKNRFEPAHALALALRPEEVKARYELSMEEAARYLRGEAVPCENRKGWLLITCQGYSLGWAKASGNLAKNHYPKGLRIQGG